MRVSRNAFVIATFLALFSCKQNSAESTTENKDPQINILKEIVVKENADFYKKDMLAWSNHFDHSEAVYWICVENDVTLRATGWKDLSKFVGDYMKENLVPESNTMLKQDKIENFQAEIAGALAFVSYRKQRKMPDGKTQTMLETRTFKMVDKQWKILAMVSAPGYGSTNSSTNIFVHNDIKP